MNIRQRILIQTLSASLAFTLVLSLLFFVSITKIRDITRVNFGELGNSAADISSYAIEEQVTDKITRIASDTAIIINETFSKIENFTNTTADIIGLIYTHKESWRPYPLPQVLPGQIPPQEPYIHAAPGVNLSRIRAETDLAGNIANDLRQITVVNRGITTSAIGGASGYIIAMDAFAWPSEDFDHRNYPWYNGAKERGGLYWTEVYVDPRGRGPAVSCGMPYYDRSSGNPEFKGVARNTVMLSDLSKIINSTRIGRTGYLFLVDRSGLKLFSSGSVDITVTRDGRIAGENLLENSSSAVRSLGYSMTLGASGMAELVMDGIPVYAAYAPINTLGWSLGVVIPVQEISLPARLIEDQLQQLTASAYTGLDQDIAVMAGIMAFMLLASLYAIALVSVHFTNSISRPIHTLTDGVLEVSGGNLNREVVVKTGDEFELLAQAFNSMGSSLRSHIEQVEQASAERQRITTELDVATRIQMSILSTAFPPFQGVNNKIDLFAEIHPAREVGGDFYDFFFIDDDHFAFLVADVSGKGVPAALFMAIAKTLIKNCLQTGELLGATIENVNRQLCSNNSAGMFVTAWVSVLEISTGRLEYVNAGHTPPLLGDWGATGGAFEFLVSPPDLVIGFMDDTIYHCQESVLSEGDILFLYTDGVTEAADTADNLYGNNRLRDFLNCHASLHPGELLPSLRSDIANFSAGAEQSDDITMMALRIHPPSAARFLKLPADIDALSQLTAAIVAELESGGERCQAPCPEKVRGQIELAVEEIFVNIARYAYPNAAPGTAGEAAVEYGVSATESGAMMRLTFTDCGKPFNPLDHTDPDINLPLEQREPGGLGLLLVKRTMDAVEYDYTNGKNCLVMTKSWDRED